MLSIAFAFADDPFALNPDELQIKDGPLKGLLLSADRRPVMIITPEQRVKMGLPDLGSQVLWVANFSEQKKYLPDRQPFHIAAIPLDGIVRAMEEVVDRSKYNLPEGKAEAPEMGLIKEVIAVGPHFHAQVMFEFSKDVLLFSQEVDPNTGKLSSVEPVHAVRSMAFSVGAARPDQLEFNTASALGRTYKRVSMFIGEKEAHRELAIGEDIRRFELKLSPQKLGEFLTLAAIDSTKVKLDRFYNAMSDGCLSVTLNYFDQLLFKVPPKRFPLTWPNSVDAVMGEFRARGIEYFEVDPVKSPHSTRARERFDPGPHNKGNIQMRTRVARALGACASKLSQATVRSSRIINTNY